jgi:hypothetical protein
VSSTPRSFVVALVAMAWLVGTSTADAHLAAGEFRLTAQQEVPPPTDAELASGTAMLTLVQIATPGGGTVTANPCRP